MEEKMERYKGYSESSSQILYSKLRDMYEAGQKAAVIKELKKMKSLQASLTAIYLYDALDSVDRMDFVKRVLKNTPLEYKGYHID